MKSTLKAHFEVELGTDGMDGLKMLMRMTPDLVLLDINMPRLDGFKVLGQIRRDPRFRELPVIVFTDQERMVDVETSPFTWRKRLHQEGSNGARRSS